MKFRTEVNPKPFSEQINYSDKLFFIGSCFTENIGNRLHELKFSTEINPFGVLYNPISVKNSLEILINRKQFTETDLQKHNDLWFSFYHHSQFSHPNKFICLQQINNRIEEAQKFLKNAEFLFITFGTAWAYKYNKTSTVVSNCHKIPAKEFKRFMLPVCEIYDEFAILHQQLKKFNPKLKIVLTLSPVRHLKDGAIQNKLSKATLLVAIHQMAEYLDDVFYFPAYEIVIDDLRDYRFFEKDLTHPNGQAVDYIFEKFQKALISGKAINLSNEIFEIVTASKHRPFNPNTKQHQEFLKRYLGKTDKLEKVNQEINLEFERNLFLQQTI